MDPRTQAALRASIAKWEQNTTNAQRALNEGLLVARFRSWNPHPDSVVTIRTSSEDCPLCGLFIDNISDEEDTYCEGCPVKARTRRDCCEGSPYDTVCDHVDVDPAHLATQALVNACQAEVDFLRSLLPEGEE